MRFPSSMLLLSVVFAAILCGVNAQGTAAFNCNYAAWDLLYDKAPNLWGDDAGSLSPQETANQKFPQCRHCWWDLGYPTSGEFVFARELRCSTYNAEFNARKIGDTLPLPNFQDLFMSRANNSLKLPNAFLAQSKLLVGKTVAKLVDLNKDNTISSAEFLVAMHFWAPLSLAQFGPSASAISSSGFEVLGWASNFGFSCFSFCEHQRLFLRRIVILHLAGPSCKHHSKHKCVQDSHFRPNA